QAILLAQGGHAPATAGEDLVRVGLMPHVPDQPVVRRVEDVVQGNGQLDDAEAGAKVTAGLADAEEQLLAQLIGQLFQFRFAQTAQLGGRRGPVEQGRGGTLAGDFMERLGHQTDRFIGVKDGAVYSNRERLPNRPVQCTNRLSSHSPSNSRRTPEMKARRSSARTADTRISRPMTRAARLISEASMPSALARPLRKPRPASAIASNRPYRVSMIQRSRVPSAWPMLSKKPSTRIASTLPWTEGEV